MALSLHAPNQGVSIHHYTPSPLPTQSIHPINTPYQPPTLTSPFNHHSISFSTETRLRIVPAASAHKIDKLLEAVDNHIQRNLYGPGNPTQEFSYASFGQKDEIKGKEDQNKKEKEKGKEKEKKVNDREGDKDNEDKEDKGNDKEDDQDQENGVKPGNGKLRRALEKWTGVMIEYILIDEINTLDIHAHQLGALLSANADRREHIILNLIPYNPTDVAEDFHPPSMENVDRFAAICMGEPYRIKTKIRREMGQDIAGISHVLLLSSRRFFLLPSSFFLSFFLP